MKDLAKQNVVSSSGLALAALLFIASIILVNSAITNLRVDLTENKLFTLSEGTKNILAKLEEPVILDFYYSRQDMVDFPLMASYALRVRDMLEEYEAHANGMIDLNIIEPETFSEEEDQAVASGLQNVTASAASNRVYFGLVGSNSTDDERVIPFFQASKEQALEYDLTKLIYNLAYPDRRVVGVLGSLPLFGDGEAKPTWTIVNAMREFFDVRDLGKKVKTEIDSDVDLLLVVHPKDFDDATIYALDQYLIKGGKAMIFLDPLAEQDQQQPAAGTQVLPIMESHLEKLLRQWGLEVTKGKLIGDLKSAMRVQARGPRGMQQIDYLPWLRLGEDNFKSDDFSTSELNLIHLGTAGELKVNEEKGLSITPLIETTTSSTILERDLILFQRDPTVILNNFVSLDKKLPIAVRVQGAITTAFPDGKIVVDKESNETRTDENQIKEGELNIILVTDTDILADHFWVREQNMFGVTIPQPVASNGDFVINSIENLSGSNDLISLRGRGKFSRPFTKVEGIRKEAEAKFREREKQLKTKLEETEKRINELKQQQGSETAYNLNKELTKEISQSRNERLKTRKQLRAVQHDLQRNIEKLGSQLKFINIGLIPLLIIILALITGIYQSNRRLRKR